MIADTINEIKSEIEKICLSVGRDPKEVSLMAVSKTVAPERIREATDCGHTLFGENKVQELLEKVEALKDTKARFHLIGHLQTNKVKKVIEYTPLIHSVDRMELALEIEKRAKAIGKIVEVLIQVNTSFEESKFGVSPDKAIDLIREVSTCAHIKIKGLMTLAKFSSREEEVRPCFKILKNLFTEIKKLNIENVDMEILSMGMSGDYKIAIEEGSTLVRVGTKIFGKRSTTDAYYWPEKKE